jgi:phytoene synthase
MTTHDEVHCRDIVRSHARTFWLASRFLPADKRRAAFALYAFCRVADDLVDLAARDGSSDRSAALRQYRRQLDDALAGRPAGPVFRELTHAASRYHVPAAVLHELLDGVARDCTPTHYATWDELSQYCAGVASSVGEMCVHVFGSSGDDVARHRAVRHARTLGVAMQLTNVLRDVGEDARNGRCYLPDSDLTQFGLDRAQVLSSCSGADARWKSLMQFEIERARALYALAMPGIPLLSPDTRRCATACAIGYASILTAIEANDFDTFSTRARLGTTARAAVLWAAWRTPVTGMRADGASPATMPDDRLTTCA